MRLKKRFCSAKHLCALAPLRGDPLLLNTSAPPYKRFHLTKHLAPCAFARDFSLTKYPSRKTSSYKIKANCLCIPVLVFCFKNQFMFSLRAVPIKIIKEQVSMLLKAYPLAL